MLVKYIFIKSAKKKSILVKKRISVLSYEIVGFLSTLYLILAISKKEIVFTAACKEF